MGNSDSKILEQLKQVCEAGSQKTKFLRSLRAVIYQKEPEYRQDFNLIIPELQNSIEKTFDRIISCYIAPKQKDEWMYDDDVAKLVHPRMTPEEVRRYLIFNWGFSEKKALIYKLFKISTATRKTLDKLNAMRNAIAHRYDENDKRYFYKEKNVLHNDALSTFIKDYFRATDEIQAIDTHILDGIARAKKEFDV